MERSLWERNFWLWPQYPCPSCKTGTLKFEKKSISRKETRSSIMASKIDGYDPERVVERFSGNLTCTKTTCKDTVFVCGIITAVLDMYSDANGSINYELDDNYIPKFFEPALPVFPVPSKCPRKVREELTRAFSLIWSDIGSAGNRLRVAVEALMNECNIQKKAKIKNGQNKGKFRDLTLDERIRIFSNKNEDAATQLLAIKWLGNIGSHAGLTILTRDDLLDAFEHFEYTLDLIYLGRSSHLVKRAKRIIEKKGSIRPKLRMKRR